MQDSMDAGNEGFRTGGMHGIRNSGLEGYCKVGVQERRVQYRRDVEQERCWTGWIGKVGYRTGGMNFLTAKNVYLGVPGLKGKFRSFSFFFRVFGDL